MKEERFAEVLKAGIDGLLKIIADVLFPCINITVTAKNFEKIQKYGDLMSFATGKDDKSKQRQLTFFKKPAQVSASVIQEQENSKFSTIPEQKEKFFPMTENSMSTVLFPEENASRSMFHMEQEGNTNTLTKAEMIEEEEAEECEKTPCEKCGDLIKAKDLVDHYDQHIAQDLDKELNPNKRKYRQIDGDHVMVSVEGKEQHKEKKDQEILAHSKKMVEHKNNLTGVSFQGIKKSLTEQEKNPGKKKIVQMKGLDSFFSKK